MSEKLKHTPGPWKNTISKSGDSYAIYSVTEKCLIVSTKRDSVVLNETWNRQLTDARLIAAAPEMLDYYKRLYKWCQMTELDISLVMMTDIGNIIEKATGQKIEDLIKCRN